MSRASGRARSARLRILSASLRQLAASSPTAGTDAILAILSFQRLTGALIRLKTLDIRPGCIGAVSVPLGRACPRAGRDAATEKIGAILPTMHRRSAQSLVQVAPVQAPNADTRRHASKQSVIAYPPAHVHENALKSIPCTRLFRLRVILAQSVFPLRLAETIRRVRTYLTPARHSWCANRGFPHA